MVREDAISVSSSKHGQRGRPPNAETPLLVESNTSRTFGNRSLLRYALVLAAVFLCVGLLSFTQTGSISTLSILARARRVNPAMMSWITAGADLTDGDYLLGSDRVARRAAQAAIADMEAQRRSEQSHCNPSSCDSDGHTVRWPNVTYRWDWAARNESRYRARRSYRKHVKSFTKYEAKQSKYLKGQGAAVNGSRLIPWSRIYNSDPRYPRTPRFRHGYNRTEYFSVTLNATLPASDKQAWVKTHDLPDWH